MSAIIIEPSLIYHAHIRFSEIYCTNNRWLILRVPLVNISENAIKVRPQKINDKKTPFFYEATLNFNGWMVM